MFSAIMSPFLSDLQKSCQIFCLGLSLLATTAVFQLKVGVIGQAFMCICADITGKPVCVHCRTQTSKITLWRGSAYKMAGTCRWNNSSSVVCQLSSLPRKYQVSLIPLHLIHLNCLKLSNFSHELEIMSWRTSLKYSQTCLYDHSYSATTRSIRPLQFLPCIFQCKMYPVRRPLARRDQRPLISFPQWHRPSINTTTQWR